MLLNINFNFTIKLCVSCNYFLFNVAIERGRSKQEILNYTKIFTK